MVQVYGVAPQDSADANAHGVEGQEGDESQALLTGRTVARATKKDNDGNASLLSCISNLSNTIIGSGAYWPYTTPSAGSTLMQPHFTRRVSRHAYLPSGVSSCCLILPLFIDH